MSVVIILHGLSDATLPEPQYLRHYDPDVNDPAVPDRSGLVVGTFDPALAKRYADKAAAMAEWRRVSVTRPLRPDGKLNRPLSAFTIEIREDA